MSHRVRNIILVAGIGCIAASLLSACLDDRAVKITYGQSVGGGDGGEGCAPDGEPSWDDPIEDIMTAKCNLCHRESTSYEEIQTWVTSGELEEYCAMGSAHYMDDGADQDACLRWLTIGVPENGCSQETP